MNYPLLKHANTANQSHGKNFPQFLLLSFSSLSVSLSCLSVHVRYKKTADEKENSVAARQESLAFGRRRPVPPRDSIDGSSTAPAILQRSVAAIATVSTTESKQQSITPTVASVNSGHALLLEQQAAAARGRRERLATIANERAQRVASTIGFGRHLSHNDQPLAAPGTSRTRSEAIRAAAHEQLVNDNGIATSRWRPRGWTDKPNNKTTLLPSQILAAHERGPQTSANGSQSARRAASTIVSSYNNGTITSPQPQQNHRASVASLTSMASSIPIALSSSPSITSIKKVNASDTIEAKDPRLAPLLAPDLTLRQLLDYWDNGRTPIRRLFLNHFLSLHTPVLPPAMIQPTIARSASVLVASINNVSLAELTRTASLNTITNPSTSATVKLVGVWHEAASLLLMRITSHLRLTYALKRGVGLQLRAIGVFLTTSPPYSIQYIREFVAAGGLLAILEISQHTTLAESEKREAIKLLRVIASAGRNYKQLICEQQGVAIVIKCMMNSNDLETHTPATQLLHELGTDNPRFASLVHEDLLAVFRSDASPLCKLGVSTTLYQLLEAPIPVSSTDDTGEAFKPDARYVDSTISLFAVPDLQLHSQAYRLLKLLASRRYNLDDVALFSLVSLLHKKSKEPDTRRGPTNSSTTGSSNNQATASIVADMKTCAVRMLGELAHTSAGMGYRMVAKGVIPNLLDCLCLMSTANFELQQAAARTLYVLSTSVAEASTTIKTCLGPTLFPEFQRDAESLHRLIHGPELEALKIRVIEATRAAIVAAREAAAAAAATSGPNSNGIVPGQGHGRTNSGYRSPRFAERRLSSRRSSMFGSITMTTTDVQSLLPDMPRARSFHDDDITASMLSPSGDMSLPSMTPSIQTSKSVPVGASKSRRSSANPHNFTFPSASPVLSSLSTSATSPPVSSQPLIPSPPPAGESASATAVVPSTPSIDHERTSVSIATTLISPSPPSGLSVSVDSTTSASTSISMMDASSSSPGSEPSSSTAEVAASMTAPEIALAAALEAATSTISTREASPQNLQPLSIDSPSPMAPSKNDSSSPPIASESAIPIVAPPTQSPPSPRSRSLATATGTTNTNGLLIISPPPTNPNVPPPGSLTSNVSMETLHRRRRGGGSIASGGSMTLTGNPDLPRGNNNLSAPPSPNTLAPPGSGRSGGPNGNSFESMMDIARDKERALQAAAEEELFNDGMTAIGQSQKRYKARQEMNAQAAASSVAALLAEPIYQPLSSPASIPNQSQLVFSQRSSIKPEPKGDTSSDAYLALHFKDVLHPRTSEIEVKQEMMVDALAPHIEVLEQTHTTTGSNNDDDKTKRDYRSTIAVAAAHRRTGSVAMPSTLSLSSKGALPRPRRPQLNAKERAVCS
jgi:hypothetical protein